MSRGEKAKALLAETRLGEKMTAALKLGSNTDALPDPEGPDLLVEANQVYARPKVDVPNHATMPGLVEQRAMRAPDLPIMERKGDLGQWLPVTCREFYQQMLHVGAGLLALGYQAGDAIAILSSTSYEWMLLDLGAQAVGLVVVPIYESDSPKQIQWICQDSQVKCVFTSTHAQAALVNSVVDLPTRIFEEDAINQLIMQGRRLPASQIQKTLASRRGEELATVVYTSGTTGKPRGVKLTHRNLTETILQDIAFFPQATRQSYVRMLLFLPLAHIYARTAAYMALAGEGVCGHIPDTRNLLSDLSTFRPTTIGAVPRVLEKIYAAADAKAKGGIKELIWKWAKRVAFKTAQVQQSNLELSLGLKFQHKLASALVFKKIVSLMGGNMHYVISGGAPLASEIEKFFVGIGIKIYQGYGLTEVTGGITCNSDGGAKIGTVGRPVPAASVKIAEDGEVLLKGTGVFAGYLNNEAATQAAFTADGWFRTGDLGILDQDGFLTISGRKKELLVTAGGKNVQPAVLEDALRTHPLISQIVVVGDKQRFIAALITLDQDMLPTWLANHKLPAMDLTQAAQNEHIKASIGAAISRANREVSQAESIRKFTILTSDFTEENGLLTPSLKVKRSKIIARFSDEISKIYAE